MKITLTTAAATAAIALAGCGSSSHTASYPANAQTNFLNACERSASVSGCDCLLTHIEKQVSFAEFQAGDRQIDNGGPRPDWLLKAAEGC